jgi:hypothetical protein
MSEATEAFIERVLAALPALRPHYEAARAECLETGFGDIVLELFFSDYVRPLLERFHAAPASGRGPLVELARVLDTEYGSDPQVDAAIESILVLMQRRSRPDPADTLGPRLRAALERQRGWRAEPADQAFVQRLIAAVPALEPLARDNTYGDHEDVLVHMFLSDVVRQLVDNLLAGHLDEVRTVLALLEEEWGGDVDEPIVVSFVENLPYPHEPGAALIGMLGPNLRAELDRQRRPT